MSVLVKSMNMPKNCMDCPLFESLYHFHGCHAKPESFNDRDMWNFAVGDRPSWCPLVEIQPHGRLIDAKALTKDLGNRWNVNDDQDFCNKEVWHGIEEAPTIIEAEDGDNDV